jgi:TolB-like protein/Flp pilus assembly protein TadD
VTEPSQAVFLSYASQDAEAAQRICEALRAAGIEVFFDQNSLRGGDAWDLKIRQEIHHCALFIPILSQHTQARLEGYFRHEWNLAIERTHHMAAQKAFLVPVVVDSTRSQDALAPEAFRAAQWTRLPGGDTPPAFVERIKHLLSPEPATLSAAGDAAGTSLKEPLRVTRRSWPLLLAIFAFAVFMPLAFVVFHKTTASKHPNTAPVDAVAPAPAAPATAAFSPPPHSLAILPFVNMSADKQQAYFSDGLTEELLNSLSRINELQVAARTSSFSFQGEHPDIAAVAHKLNVSAVLEGSVRRSGHTVRITAQLINGLTGFHLWSETYDRDLKDVLKLQTEIATAVAGALKVTLLGDETARIEVGGTHNPAAFDAYLRASKAYWQGNYQVAIDGYREAISLDPLYALAYAARSITRDGHAGGAADAAAVGAELREAQDDAGKAIALAPNLSEGHLALALVYTDLLSFPQATEEYERALALNAGSARILRDYGQFAALMGRGDVALKLLHRAVALDPMNENSTGHLAIALVWLRRYAEARAAFEEGAANSTSPGKTAMIGFTYYLQGDFEAARSACEEANDEDIRMPCLAITYDKLGRQSDAKTVLTRAQAQSADSGAVVYALVYAQWGDTAQALEWLEKANRAKNPDLVLLKQPMFDPLRKEPRFQTIERGLKFPD